MLFDHLYVDTRVAEQTVVHLVFLQFHLVIWTGHASPYFEILYTLEITKLPVAYVAIL